MMAGQLFKQAACSSLAVFLWAASSIGQVPAGVLDLAGTWRFALNRESHGPALPVLPGDMEYSRSRSASADVDEAGMDDRRPRRDSRP